MMLAGSACVSITPNVTPESPAVWLAGYCKDRKATAVHDELTARALLLESSGKRVAWITLDLIGLFLDEIQRIRGTLRFQRLGIDHLVVTCTHTHSGPDTLGLWSGSDTCTQREDYLSMVRDRVLRALEMASASREEARLRFGEATTPGLIRDAIPPEVIDDQLRVMSVTSAVDGKNVATVVNWSNHAEVLGAENLELSADFPMSLRQHVEGEVGGVAMFVPGAIGGLMTPHGVEIKDPCTRKPAEEFSFRKMELLGQQVAEIALEAIREEALFEDDLELDFEVVDFEVPVTNLRLHRALESGVLRREFHRGSDGRIFLPTECSRLRLGPAIILAVPGEIYPELVLHGQTAGGGLWPRALEDLVDATPLFVFGLANDELGYIIPPGDHSRNGNSADPESATLHGELAEAVNSPGMEFAPRLFAALEPLLKGQPVTAESSS